MSELLWIAVPGGRSGGGPVVRVVVVPKLDEGTVGASRMATWPPAGLPAATDVVVEWRADESGPVTPTPVPPEALHFDHVPGLWARAVAPDVAVGTGRTPPVTPEVKVDPTSSLADDIDATFAPPAAAPFTTDQPVRPEGYDALVLAGLEAWHAPEVPAPAPSGTRELPPPPDFHRVISLLREHPAVLRALGLIFAVHVDPPADLAAEGQVRVTWPGADATLPGIVAPWSRYGPAFLPTSPSGLISAGMVTLTPDPAAPPAPRAGGWRVLTVDAEGGARKLRDAARIVAGTREAPAAVDPRLPVSLPALRSAGLQLVRVDRAADFDDTRRVATENATRAVGEQVLGAEQLTLGYRIDVKRGGGDWLSLHERLAAYTVAGEPVGPPEEEGHVKASAAVRGDDGIVRTPETVARWDGWSLAIPRPRFDGVDRRARRRDGVALPIDYDFHFAVKPGSLPGLRFTAQYAVRARVVDMAGEGLGHRDPAADRCAITEIRYGRYQPVPSPDLLLEEGVAPKELGPAETIDRIVVRSTPETSVEDFPAANPGHPLHPRRALHRPRASLELAEQHGMLDGQDDGPDYDRTFEWVERALAAAAPPDPGAPPPTDPLPDPAAGGIQAVPLPAPNAPAAAFARRDWLRRWPEPEDPKAIELRGRATGEQPLTWEGETLVVRLAASEQLTIELSSTLTENFWDHFSLRNDVSKQASEVGRNPLITPAGVVTLVHAVRRPMWKPREDLRLDARPRESGQTFAVLDPLAEALMLHSASTGQMDLTAEWQEQRDEQDPRTVAAPVQTVRVDPGDTGLAQDLRQEFGDTRHRRVAYTLTAVTRFRQYFLPLPVPPGQDPPPTDPEAFVERRTPPAVIIPNTGKPAAPVVLSVRPAFVWKESVTSEAGATTLRRQRVGGMLRVELARPWYQTGVGERLAVVLWDRSGTTPAPAILGLITQAGRDPIWETPDPERWPTEQAFAANAEAAETTELTENGSEVVVVPYEAWLHEDRWYADVAVPGLAAASYCPFVELAVARYQRESIVGHDISPVVRTEPVQLLPDRTLTVRRLGTTLTVALDGLGPGGPLANRVDVVLETCDLPAGMVAADVGLTAFAPGRAGVPAWTEVPGATRQTTLGTAAQVELPAGPGAFRVRVREVELIGGAPGAATATPAELSERVVFTDAVAPPA